MKKYFAVSVLAASILAVTGCQEEKAEAPAVAQVALENEGQQQAYAIGASVSRYIATTLEQQKELGLELDNALVLKGMQDGLSGEVAMSEEEIQLALKALDEKLAGLVEAKTAEDAAAAQAESAKYLSDNAAREGVSVTESGLQFEVLTDAEGDKPSAADTVTVHYKGTLTDGTTFDSSYDRGEPATFPLNRVIPGWTEGVQLMSKGAKYKFFIPSELGYGENGAGSIPPNSILVFEVELMEIEKADAAAETPAS
ncbi:MULTISPECIES: FKBP-type peptidyl-prolyl cis-trans isomerase [unclassified Agarivorans]|uniref:FKBP-type peptidyl-prolyl cis-trans isomerase n=1 Tax=unclassified Agarivorans TaxID=2636026 RepID=UPI0010D550FB|nr:MULTISPECIES: FKBP-type peptidyl-prolyl cis-trans isomerase [unclassified Agarivorans]MDO6686684.1 FKBP-type peptidyl-prolyl cis-trans isomerase [Agarivorans sp. 3_MG-2023]MDO6716586.1 FKBP-type peptidyl-prolyl cis-trans isomerase [Agarivorans sp. 2_MG-2023]MDO6765525.1 FKBP-type peptidyl-prolyl cis-trans isomerase [Agarivorans sp. 1_MG-2023]GDY26646.1 peptidyl-prolyl cis-trans isomerase [Agarivorans sp. Toyoura001]